MKSCPVLLNSAADNSHNQFRSLWRIFEIARNPAPSSETGNSSELTSLRLQGFRALEFRVQGILSLARKRDHGARSRLQAARGARGEAAIDGSGLEDHLGLDPRRLVQGLGNLRFRV